jgi:hypothetical protein
MRRAPALGLLLVLAASPASTALAAKPKPKPRLGHTVVVSATDGRVTVKPRHGKRTRLTKTATAIPVGTTVDATRGKVLLVTAKGRYTTQHGTFSQGAFVVTQERSGLTDLTLTGGSFAPCTAARAAGAQVHGAANTRRRLFGTAHGRFQTRGRNSSASVRGTTWLTEDRCNGTVIENKSPSPSSKVDTQSRNLTFNLDPGQTITYYCNHLSIQPDTYCVMLLAYPDQGVVAGGIITQVNVDTYQFCVKAPDGQVGCTDPLPLAPKDQNGFRQGIFACPVRQAGTFEFGWSIDGQNLLFPTLSLKLNVVGPNEHCQTIPTTDQPIAKGLPQP